MTASTMLNPTIDNPVMVIVFPGTYTEPIALASNVALVALATNTVFVNTLTWTSVSSNEENIAIDNLTVQTLILDTSGKPSGVRSIATLNDVTVTTSCSVTNTVSDALLVVRGCRFLGPGGLSISGMPSIRIFSSEVNNGIPTSLSLVNTTGTINGCLIGQTSMDGGIIVNVDGCRVQSLTVTNGVFVRANNSVLGFVSVASPAQADLKSSEYTTLTGTGNVDRSVFNLTNVALANGANVIAISPPYRTQGPLNNQYRVVPNQTNGTATPLVFSSYTQTDFTATIAVVGTSWNFQLVQP